MTRLYFIRHGESEANLQKCFAGWYDCSLTEKGRAQAEATADFLNNVPFTAVYASDLHRAYDTGKAVAVRRGLPVNPVKELREINAGAWEKMSFDQLAKSFSKDYGVWLDRIGMAVCTEGEAVAHLQQRVRTAVEDIVRRHPGETVCIATHATPIRTLECVWRNIPLERMHTVPWVKNASVTIAEYNDEGVGRLIQRNLCEHLGVLNTALPANV